MNRRTDASGLDRYFRSLADGHRRRVLSHLIHGSDGSSTVEELVDGVVDAAPDTPRPDRRSVEITLAHVHLPMLANQGLIEYDRERDVVSATDLTEQMVPYIAVVEDPEFPDAS